MSTLGFSGTRHLTDGDVKSLTEYLMSQDMTTYLNQFDRFVTGACIGWDAFVGGFLYHRFPDKKHIVVVPADRSRVDYWYQKFGSLVDVYEMAPGTKYYDRNRMIVFTSDQLFYCAAAPESASESTRSGTWQTVRLARARGIHVDGIVLHDKERA